MGNTTETRISLERQAVDALLEALTPLPGAAISEGSGPAIASGPTAGVSARAQHPPAAPRLQFADGSFIGDFSQVAIGSDGMAHAAWTYFRGTPGVNGPNQDVYVSSYAP